MFRKHWSRCCQREHPSNTEVVYMHYAETCTRCYPMSLLFHTKLVHILKHFQVHIWPVQFCLSRNEILSLRKKFLLIIHTQTQFHCGIKLNLPNSSFQAGMKSLSNKCRNSLQKSGVKNAPATRSKDINTLAMIPATVRSERSEFTLG